jgi:hypothetical protein
VTGLQPLATELAITMADREVWISIGVALLFGGGCLVFGIWVARTVGLLRSDAPVGETLGVGLASGLMVLAAWWAAIWSGGRSSFTPVAVGFAVALVLAMTRRVRRYAVPDAVVSAAAEYDGDATIPTRSPPRRSLLLTALAGAVFVVAIALLYGATLAPSPRDGVQPVDGPDQAFYAVLGRDLATTGTETIYSPSGFTDLPGLPSQTWYHWGELWLTAAIITLSGSAPLAARCFIVLPVLLLAAGALTGTLVRRFTGISSRGAQLFGFLACLFLAPMTLVPGPTFSGGVGLVYGIAPYGLAAVAALLALYGLAVLGTRRSTWALACFAGTAAAFLLPAHLVIAVLGLVGVGSIWAIRIVQSVIARRRLPTVSPIWRRTFIATGMALVATVVWGLVTGHGLTSGGVPPSVSPFNASWRDAIAIQIMGTGVFLGIPIAWLLAQKTAPLQADMYLGTMVVLAAGAIVWGARLADYNTFYFFYGSIAIFATPVAAVAIRWLWERLRRTQHLRLAFAVTLLCVVQLDWGWASGVTRLWQYGPVGYQPIPLSLLGAIRQMPADAKLAYACRPFQEASYADTQLLSINAHTGRRVVPMCFEADVVSARLGVTPSLQRPIADLAWAPQRALYPDAQAHPSSAAVTAFLKDHGIDYIYADAVHPNSLVGDAVVLARTGDAEVLSVP